MEGHVHWSVARTRRWRSPATRVARGSRSAGEGHGRDRRYLARELRPQRPVFSGPRGCTSGRTGRHSSRRFKPLEASSSRRVRMALGPTPWISSSSRSDRSATCANLVMPCTASSRRGTFPIDAGNSVSSVVNLDAFRSHPETAGHGLTLGPAISGPMLSAVDPCLQALASPHSSRPGRPIRPVRFPSRRTFAGGARFLSAPPAFDNLAESWQHFAREQRHHRAS